MVSLIVTLSCELIVSEDGDGPRDCEDGNGDEMKQYLVITGSLTQIASC